MRQALYALQDLKLGNIVWNDQHSVQGTRDLELGMWGVYKFGSLKKSRRESAKPKLDVMQKQEDRWDKRGTTADDEDDDEGEMEMMVITLGHDCLYISKP